MFTPCVLVVEHIVKSKRSAYAAGVVTSTSIVASVARLVWVKEVHHGAVGALHRQARIERKAWQEGESGLAGSDELVVVGAVVLGARQILKRAGHVDTVEVVIVLSGVVGIPYRSIGGSVDDRHEHAATVGTCTRDDASAVGVVRVGYRSVEPQPLLEVVLHRCTDVVAAEIGLAEHTGLFGEAAGNHVAELVCSVGHLQLVVLHGSRAERFVHPVGLVGESFGQLHESNLVLQLLILPCVEHLGSVVHARERVVGIEAHLCHAGLALLGSDDDHTVCSAATVDGCRRGILEYLDVGNVVGCKEVDILERHTVNDVERVVGTIERGCTTHADGRCRTRLTVGLRYVQTGCLALHTLSCAHDGAALKVFGRH